MSDLEAKQNYYGYPRWFSYQFTIPPHVYAVKPVWHSCMAGGGERADLILMKRQTNVNDSNVVRNYLINDPGSRDIIFMGDSWTDGWNRYCPNMAIGLAAALRDRTAPNLGRDISSQIVCAGHGGDTSLDALKRFPALLEGRRCSDAPSQICVDDGECVQVGGGACVRGRPLRPLYAIIHLGINDLVAPGITQGQTMANLEELVRRCQIQGIIPIVMTTPPVEFTTDGHCSVSTATPCTSPVECPATETCTAVGQWGVSSIYGRSHALRMAQLHRWMGF